MRTIGERKQRIFAPKGAHSVGIEIEIEQANIPSLPKRFDMWKITQDDSLRDGQELVTALPVWKVNLEEAYEQFDAIIATAQQPPACSWRCSTHVHLDIRDLTVTELKAVMIAVCFTDTLITKANGREGSNFCVPYRSAHPVHQAFQKYSSAGLFRLKDLGTIEFRMFKSVSTSAELRGIVDTVHAYRAIADNPDPLFRAVQSKSISAVQQALSMVLFGSPFTQEYITEELTKGFAAAVVLMKSEDLLDSIIRSQSNYEERS